MISIDLRKYWSVSKLWIIKNRSRLIISAQPVSVKFCLDKCRSSLSAREAPAWNVNLSLARRKSGSGRMIIYLFVMISYLFELRISLTPFWTINLHNEILLVCFNLWGWKIYTDKTGWQDLHQFGNKHWKLLRMVLTILSLELSKILAKDSVRIRYLILLYEYSCGLSVLMTKTFPLQWQFKKIGYTCKSK